MAEPTISSKGFDEVMSSLFDGRGKIVAEEGVGGELHRLMPRLTEDQVLRLFNWILALVASFDPGSDHPEEHQQMLAFVIGIEIGQQVGRVEAGG